MDRFDLQIEILPLSYEEMSRGGLAESSASVRERIVLCRERQVQRFRQESDICCNAQMPNSLLSKYAKPDTAGTLLLKDAMEKLEAYLRRGGNAVVTTGFFRQNYDNGMKDLTSVRLTHRHVLCDEYMISHYNYRENAFCKGHEKLLFEILSYKTNATCPDVGLIAGEHTFPLMTEDSYGKGRLFILNVPENFADLYKLPKEVWQGIAKHLSMGQRVYIAGEGRHSFLAYDNNTYAIQSYNPMQDTVNVIVFCNEFAVDCCA